MVELLTAAGLSVGMVLFALMFFLGIFWPFATWWAARSLSRIHRELARMNDNLERSAVVEGSVRPYVKTGPLNIR